MSDAVHGRRASSDENSPYSDPEVEAVAEAYIAAAAGNVRDALSLASFEVVAATKLVSRGFARWGQPEKRTW